MEAQNCTGGLATSLRQPTALTRVLQICLPGYVAIAAGQHVIAQLREGVLLNDPMRLVPGPEPALVFDVFLVGLLTVGSYRRWAWAYWVLFLVLGFNVASEAVAVFQVGALRVFNDLSWVLLFGPVLFGACVYALFRYGRHGWAQIEMSSKPVSLSTLPPSNT
jgi:hypothetical protein